MTLCHSCASTDGLWSVTEPAYSKRMLRLSETHKNQALVILLCHPILTTNGQEKYLFQEFSGSKQCNLGIIDVQTNYVKKYHLITWCKRKKLKL